MTLVPIRIESAADPAALRHQLEQLAGEIDARFVHAGTILAHSVETIGRVIATLDTLVGALDERSADAAAHALAESARVLDALPAMQAERVEDVAFIRRGTGDIQRHAAQIREAMRVLSVNGTNLRLVATGSPALADLIEPLVTCFDRGEVQYEMFAAELGELAAHIASVRRVARLFASECARVVPAVPRKLAEVAGALRAHRSAIVDCAASVGALARSARERVDVVLCALQIGDITRQRIEHVVAALQLISDSALGRALPPVSREEPAARGAAAHLLRLLAAQLTDAANEFEGQTGVLVAGLRELAPDAVRLHALMDSVGADRGERDFFHALERGIVDVDRLTEQLRVANERSRVLARAIGEAFQRMVRRADTLGASHAELQRIAAAVKVRGADLGSAGQSAVAIGNEMLACVARLDDARAAIAATIATLADPKLGMRHRERFNAQIAASAGLGKSLASIRLACRRTEQDIGETGLDARDLVEGLDDAAARLDRELPLSASLRDIAEAMHALGDGERGSPAEATALLQALLPQVAGCYSMARERDIHRGHLPPGMHWVCPAEIAEDDDGLF